MNGTYKIARLTSLALLMIAAFGCQSATSNTNPGLVGLYFSEPDLTAVKAKMLLTDLEQKWDDSTYQTTGSSGIWDGSIIAPADGDVTLYLSTNKVLELHIGDHQDARADLENPESQLVVAMRQDESYPVRLTFLNDGKKDGSDIGAFSIKWSWGKNQAHEIPASSLRHTAKQLAAYKFIDEPDLGSIDRSQSIYIEAEHHVAYYEQGRFGGWPANSGVWNWGDEILVAFNRAYYKHNPFHHSIDRAKPGGTVMSRSLDGGVTWTLEQYESSSQDSGAGVTMNDGVDFADPNLAVRIDRNYFVASYDRGKTWSDALGFAGLDTSKLSSRTDYLVSDADEALFFLSADDVETVQAILQDRSFLARTKDGGQSFEFVSWMADEENARSVMSSTVRISESHLVTTMRRRFDPAGDFRVMPKNWIDAYESHDNGQTWNFLTKIADTDTGLRNGNPPALVRTDEGLLAVSYGYRGAPYGIRARVSADDGATWSREVTLRDDASTWDIGYCRSVVRSDGNIVTIYYYATDEWPEQHIEATIWNPRLAL